jgi:hypothetical protein
METGYGCEVVAGWKAWEVVMDYAKREDGLYLNTIAIIWNSIFSAAGHESAFIVE